MSEKEAQVPTPNVKTQVHIPRCGEVVSSTRLLYECAKKDGGGDYLAGGNYLVCDIPLGDGLEVEAIVVGDILFVQSKTDKRWQTWGGDQFKKVDPFVQVEVLGEAHHRAAVRTQPPRYANAWEQRVWDIHNREKPSLKSYLSPYYERHRKGEQDPSNLEYLPWIFLPVRVTTEDGSVREEVVLRFRWPERGKIIFPEESSSFPHNLGMEQECHGLALRRECRVFLWSRFRDTLHNYEVDPEKLWTWYLSNQGVPARLADVDQKGTKGLESRKAIKPNLTRLAQEEPLLFSFYLWLHDSRTEKRITNNWCISTMLRVYGESYEKLRDALRDTMSKADTAEKYGEVRGRPMCLLLPGVAEARQGKKVQKQWYEHTSNQKKAEALGVCPEKHPKLHKAICEGKIPLMLFYEPGRKGKSLINVEFDLWEQCLQRKGWGEVLFQIATEAASRTTYTHLITSYMAFLFKIEKYLDRHTEGRKKWKAYPKFVKSQWELEMEEATEEGTTKQRSALTPLVDNEARTVHVPYVSMAVSGRRTTYCYAGTYVVFEEGHNDSYGNGVVVRDLEEKLNGRDDYGLMYYTLTGTDVNRGYPTFLIIFERTTQHGTRVHFHRVHPSRKKNGTWTPTCQLVAECYRYMAGNIRAEEIYAQQGDMLFISSAEPRGGTDGAVGIKEFESHAFASNGDTPVVLVESKAKSIKNRLGHVFAVEDFTLEHPEHENVPMPAGWYEVRRCRSWEANPRAVWSLMID